jgi:hypothetical protein
MGNVPSQLAPMYGGYYLGECYWHANVPVWQVADWFREYKHMLARWTEG